MACPQCGERRVDELTLNDDGSVVCATCGRRYRLDSADAPEDLGDRVVAGLALTTVSLAEEVHCECGDRQCGCEGSCTALASHEWGSVDDGDWQYLCYACALRLLERGTRYADGEEVAGDA